MSAKVFVGNLVFSTTDEQLKEAFAGSANVVTANMITRGRRSLGYGFVEFATEEDAVKAVEAMNKKEVDGRPINVELARPRDPAKEEEAAQKKAARVAKPRAPRAPKGESSGAASSNGQAATSSSVEGASPVAGRVRRAPGAKRTGAGRRGGNKSNGEGSAVSANGASPAATTAAPRRQRNTNNTNNNSGSAEDRALSETTLFVANVPFSSDDDQLKSYFAEHNPKAAHIVRMRNGRSRGYGFVEFDTLDGQKAGLTVDGKEVPIQSGGTLKLSVKVAMANRAPSETGAASDAPAASETPK